MQSNSITPGTQNAVNRQAAQKAVGGPQAKKETKAAAQVAAESPKVAEPEDTLPLGMVLEVTPEVVEKAMGQEVTLAFVPTSEKEALQKKGAFFPNDKQAVLGDGVGPEGDIEVVPLYDTQNPKTTEVARAIEVDKSLLELDPETGQQKIASYTPVMLAQGEGVLPADSKAVPSGATVIPEGYEATLSLGQEARKAQGKRRSLNNLSRSLSGFSGSSLAGIVNIPVITQAAPLLALGSVGFAVNQNMEAKTEAKKQLGYLEQQQKKSETDLVELQAPNGFAFNVSAKGEKARLEAQVRQANLQLGSAGLLALSGGSSLVGMLGSAGVSGFTALAGATAAAPWLAGGSMLLGQGAMVWNSLATLGELKNEKQELLEMQAKGETHVDRVFEGMNQQLGRFTAAKNEVVKVPIEERLKEIEKSQKTERLKATAFTGLMGSVVNLVSGAGATVGLGAGAVAGLALTPAALLLGGQSIGQLKELGAERKELEALQAKGETMVDRELQQGDLNYATERVPISTLLAENKKARNLNWMKLTAAGSYTGALALGIGGGLGMVAAAPAVLVPLAVGAALYPDKAKEFAGKVWDRIQGVVGEPGKITRTAKKNSAAAVEGFQAAMDKNLADMKKSSPHLFEERPGYLSRTWDAGGNPLAGIRKQAGGYFHELNLVVESYAKSANPTERREATKRLEEFMAHAPEEAKPGLAAFQQEFQKLSMNVEAEWLARDIALEMRTPVTKKLLADDRVKARVGELDYPTDADSLKAQYEESLNIENSPTKISELMTASQQGDQNASRLMARTEVFKAGRILAMKERNLGVELYTRYVDALQRPEDTENLELLTKEVGYKQQTPVTEDEVNMVSGALRTLSTPLQLAKTNPVADLHQADSEQAQKLMDLDAKISNPDTFKGMSAQEALAERTKLNAQFQAARRELKSKAPEALKAWQEAKENPQVAQEAAKPVVLVGPEARMETAFRGLTQERPELAKEFGDAFHKLNDPSQYQGMNAQETQQARLAAQLEFNKAKGKLEKKAPQLMALWDGARQEAETAHFEREMDHQLKDKVLARENVSEAAKRLEISAEELESLYMGMMKSQILADPRDLQASLVDESGKNVDPKKGEMLQIIDQSLLRTVAEDTQGGADFQAPPQIPQRPQDDPSVQAFLQQAPGVTAALTSEGFGQLAEQMKLPVEAVQDAYLTLVQADLNPALATEFNGRLEDGDMQAINTFKVGQAALGYVQEFVKPDPELVKKGVEDSMQGLMAQTVLQDPGIKELAGQLGVDAEASMRLYLQAEIGRDPAILGELQNRAAQGDTAAANQFQFLQQMIPAVQYVAQQIQSGALQQQQAPETPPAA